MRPARLARLSLVLTATAFGGFGAALLIAPQLLATVGVEITRPAGAVELRGFYGGLELGLAVFFAVAVARAAWYRPGLVVQILTLGGAAVGRAVGIIIAGGGETLIYMLMSAEIVGAGVGILALRRLPDEPTRDARRT